jgi:ribosomal protein S4
MPRKAEVLNSLSRGSVRASMSKFNLLNLYKKPRTSFQGKTLYQQKWALKRDTRAYHGEHLTELRWKQLFDPRLESVAQLDASLKGVAVAPTPMPLQTYAALERRLEFALFRAMFALSVRQARQFILAGDVSVNGVVVKHPLFPLRAGDLFHVTPDRVLQAMGRGKPSVERAVRVDNLQIGAWNKFVKTAQANPAEVWQVQRSKPALLDPARGVDREAIQRYNALLQQQMLKEQKETTRELILGKILARAHAAGADTADTAVDASAFDAVCGKHNAAKCFQVWRHLHAAKHPLVASHLEAAVAAFIARKLTDASAAEHKVATACKQLLLELVKLHTEHLRQQCSAQQLSENAKLVPYDPQFAAKLRPHRRLDKDEVVADELKARVRLPWQRGLFGRQDATKPYFTPWAPRPFMGCFAVLPHHIEVSFDTCHAIYLRNPVARPGHSEVISPFPEAAHERAYMYYARKGM